MMRKNAEFISENLNLLQEVYALGRLMEDRSQENDKIEDGQGKVDFVGDGGNKQQKKN